MSTIHAHGFFVVHVQLAAKKPLIISPTSINFCYLLSSLFWLHTVRVCFPSASPIHNYLHSICALLFPLFYSSRCAVKSQ